MVGWGGRKKIFFPETGFPARKVFWFFKPGVEGKEKKKKKNGKKAHVSKNKNAF